jgi:hypothetical protein
MEQAALHRARMLRLWAAAGNHPVHAAMHDGCVSAPLLRARPCGCCRLVQPSHREAIPLSSSGGSEGGE